MYLALQDDLEIFVSNAGDTPVVDPYVWLRRTAPAHSKVSHSTIALA
jgi:hypothetical protein